MNDQELIDSYAIEDPSYPGRYWFSGLRATHTREQALFVIKSCLALRVPVTDVVTSEAWFRLIKRVVTIENQLERLDPDGVRFRSLKDGD